MSLTLLEKDMNIISALADEPNDTDGMTSAELKATFDEGCLAVKDYINNTLIPLLEAFGVEALVQYRSDSVKYLRTNTSGGLDISFDGTVWTTILGSSSSESTVSAVKLNGTSYTPTNYVVTLPDLFVGVGSCDTAAATKDKAVTISNFGLVSGAFVTVAFTNGNTNENMTLNVSGTGAKDVYWQNSTTMPADISANRIASFAYDGTVWRMVACDDFVTATIKKMSWNYHGYYGETVGNNTVDAKYGSFSTQLDTLGINEGVLSTIVLPAGYDYVQVNIKGRSARSTFGDCAAKLYLGDDEYSFKGIQPVSTNEYFFFDSILTVAVNGASENIKIYIVGDEDDGGTVTVNDLLIHAY